MVVPLCITPFPVIIQVPDRTLIGEYWNILIKLVCITHIGHCTGELKITWRVSGHPDLYGAGPLGHHLVQPHLGKSGKSERVIRRSSGALNMIQWLIQTADHLKHFIWPNRSVREDNAKVEIIGSIRPWIKRQFKIKDMRKKSTKKKLEDQFRTTKGTCELWDQCWWRQHGNRKRNGRVNDRWTEFALE